MYIQPSLFSSDLEIEFFDVINPMQKHKLVIASKEGLKAAVLRTQITSIKSYLNGLYESRKQAYTDPTVLTLSYFEATETILKEMLNTFDAPRVLILIDILKKNCEVENQFRKIKQHRKVFKNLR